MIPGFPVQPGVSALQSLMAQMFGPANAAGAPPAAGPTAGTAANPPAASPPPPPFAGSTMTQGGPAQNALTEGMMNGGPSPTSPTASTPTSENRSTPDGYFKPPGQVLAKVRDTTGSGALKGIEASKGKSKWGAFATGLASGMSSQEAAELEARNDLTRMIAGQWTMNKDLENMQRQNRLADSTINYQGAQTRAYDRGEYGRWSAAIGGRLRDPAQIESDRTMAFNRYLQGLQTQGLKPEQIAPLADAYRKQLWGDQGAAGAAAPTPAAPAKPKSFLESLFGGSGMPAPGAAPNPAVGHGQPVQVKPGAPPGTPKITPNGDASLARPASKEDYDALPPGARYVHPTTGEVKRKNQ